MTRPRCVALVGVIAVVLVFGGLLWRAVTIDDDASAARWLGALEVVVVLLALIAAILAAWFAFPGYREVSTQFDVRVAIANEGDATLRAAILNIVVPVRCGNVPNDADESTTIESGSPATTSSSQAPPGDVRCSQCSRGTRNHGPSPVAEFTVTT